MKCKPKVYRTERAAKKFLAECNKRYPEKDFFITIEPNGFGWCVAFFLNNSDKAVYMSALKGFKP